MNGPSIKLFMLTAAFLPLAVEIGPFAQEPKKAAPVKVTHLAPAVSDFGVALAAFIEASRKNFTHLKGRPDPNGWGEVWASILTLPGAELCEIYNYSDRTMGDDCQCRIARAQDRQTLMPAFERFADSIKSSLPDRWEVKERKSGESSLKASEAVSDANLELKIVKVLDRYELRVIFSAPAEN
jgi:hypothetical protein